MRQTKETWVKKRHTIVKKMLLPFFFLGFVAPYRCKIEKFPDDGRNYLILSNHQTDIDQFAISCIFKQPIYFVAMEDIFSKSLPCRIMQWGAAPIPIVKASKDMKAVRNCVHVAREGGTIALFPEGNRTYSGKSCYIKPQVASLVKLIGLPVAIVHIEGGYGVKPRWADTCRKGYMRAAVHTILEPETYKAMSTDDLYNQICQELHVDDTTSSHTYQGSAIAEHLERMLYTCPTCGLTVYETNGNLLTCTKCRKSYRYSSDFKLEPTDRTSEPISVSDWYDRQESFIRNLDLNPWTDIPMYCDTVRISEVIKYQGKEKLADSTKLSLFSNRLEIENSSNIIIWDFSDILSMACISGHKLNIFHKDKIYQITGDDHFNALKYCNIYFHDKYIKEGDTHGEFQFLGL